MHIQQTLAFQKLGMSGLLQRLTRYTVCHDRFRSESG